MVAVDYSTWFQHLTVEEIYHDKKQQAASETIHNIQDA